MHKSKLKQLRLAVFLAFLPLYVSAAGLGKLTVNSGLGEPLSADIELVATTPEELVSLSAIIAPEEAYIAQGVERSAIHNAIRVEVVKKPRGNSLHLSSNQPISDPFLDMLIQVEWSTGRLIREYTVLLDPPGYSADQEVNNIATPEVTAVSQSGDSISPIVNSAIPTPSASITSSSSVTPAENGRDKIEALNQNRKIEKGDTLSKVANELMVEGVSLDQMLVGLYQANKEAFSGDNMNQLKVGQIIKVPSKSELQSISKQKAAKEIRVQAADWQAYRNKLAGVVEQNAKASEDVPSKSTQPGNEVRLEQHSAAKGKISAPAVDKTASTEATPKDVIKLSKSESIKKKEESSDTAKAMKDKLNALQEEGLAREKGVKEASERVASLEKQVDDLQKLLTLKNKSLADMQNNAEVLKTTPQIATTVESAKQDASSQASEIKAPNQVTQTPEVQNPEVVKPGEMVKPSQPMEASKPLPVAEPPQESAGMVGMIISSLSPVVIGGSVGALGLIVGGWMWMRNKRKRNLDSFEKGILTAGGLKANTVFGNTAGGTVDTGDTSFLTDFSQSVNGMIDTHDVDPIAEAEVYMAYGREAQAEEILNDAISRDPQRYELHLKLLEIYASRNDTSAFEAISGELYSSLGVTHPVWAKVAELGHKIEPSNPLYDVSSAAAETIAFDVTTAGMSAVVSTSQPTRVSSLDKLDAGDFDSAELMTESSLDFSLGDDDLDSSNQTEGDSISFDLGSSSNAMEFDLSDSLEDTQAVPSSSSEELTDFAMDFSEDNLEIADTGTVLDFNETIHVVDTQEESFDISMPDLEMPVAENIVEQIATPSLENTLSFEIPEMTVSDVVEPLFEKSDVADLDFNFDLGATESELSGSNLPSLDIADFSEKMMEEKASSVAAEIDLSGISLDLDELPSSSTDNMSFEIDGVEELTIGSAAESEDVNTKLDLVSAYIDMGDTEGARELLDEVLKEGGAAQRERAEKLLASL